MIGVGEDLCIGIRMRMARLVGLGSSGTIKAGAAFEAKRVCGLQGATELSILIYRST